MKSKVETRFTRTRRIRNKINILGGYRLSINKTNKHIYAQVCTADGARTIAFSSTLDTDLKAQSPKLTGIKAAELLGEKIAKLTLSKGVSKVSFDRAGYKYHGCVKALADFARKNGLEF